MAVCSKRRLLGSKTSAAAGKRSFHRGGKGRFVADGYGSSFFALYFLLAGTMGKNAGKYGEKSLEIAILTGENPPVSLDFFVKLRYYN